METKVGLLAYIIYTFGPPGFRRGSLRHAQFYSGLIVLALEHIHSKRIAYRAPWNKSYERNSDLRSFKGPLDG